MMPRYFACIHLAASNLLKSRFQLLGRLFFYGLTILIFSQLWELVAHMKNIPFSIHPADMIWYIAVTEWGVLSEPYIHSRLENDIKTGDIAYFLLQPISYIAMRFYEGFGIYVVNLFIFGIFGMGIATFLSGSVAPVSFYLIPALILCILSGILSFFLQLIIGLSTFWFGEISGLALLYRKLTYLLGGLLFPLTIYPGWMQKLAYLTPFPWMICHRAEIIYTQNIKAVMDVFIMLSVWLLIMYCIVQILFRICLKRLAIHGG